MKVHGLNDCPKLDEAQKDKLWANRKAVYLDRKAKKVVTHADVAESAPAAAPASPPSVAIVPSVPSNDHAGGI